MASAAKVLRKSKRLAASKVSTYQECGHSSSSSGSKKEQQKLPNEDQEAQGSEESKKGKFARCSKRVSAPSRRTSRVSTCKKSGRTSSSFGSKKKQQKLPNEDQETQGSAHFKKFLLRLRFPARWRKTSQVNTCQERGHASSSFGSKKKQQRPPDEDEESESSGQEEDGTLARYIPEDLKKYESMLSAHQSAVSLPFLFMNSRIQLSINEFQNIMQEIPETSFKKKEIMLKIQAEHVLEKVDETLLEYQKIGEEQVKHHTQDLEQFYKKIPLPEENK